MCRTGGVKDSSVNYGRVVTSELGREGGQWFQKEKKNKTKPDGKLPAWFVFSKVYWPRLTPNVVASVHQQVKRETANAEQSG